MKHFNAKKVRNILDKHVEFVTNLFSVCNVPDSIEDDNYSDKKFLLDSTDSAKGSKLHPTLNKTQNADELQQKLDIMKNKWQSKKSKPSEKSIQRRQQKKLKKAKHFKKQLVSIAKSVKNEKIKEEKTLDDSKSGVKSALVYNEEGKIVFPKFEFAAQKSKGKKSKKDKVEKNPRIILQKIKKEQKHIKDLQEKGDEEKAKKVASDLAWKKAFDKVEGKKVKDDTTLLHKTIKRRKLDKKKSKSEWKQREKKVAAGVEERQKKRQENINKKRDEKKKHKLKKLTKRGRVIPGYG